MESDCVCYFFSFYLVSCADCAKGVQHNVRLLLCPSSLPSIVVNMREVGRSDANEHFHISAHSLNFVVLNLFSPAPFFLPLGPLVLFIMSFKITFCLFYLIFKSRVYSSFSMSVTILINVEGS